MADEIVVAVDDRASQHVIDALRTVADRVIGYPYAEPVDRPLPWLHRQASGDWLLTIDDDEIPSSGLIEALPDLVAATDVTHYWLPRRWLYPDETRYLDARPWCSDYQLRLVLNDLRLIRFPDETHWPITVLGPTRYLDVSLYHADCVLNSREARERKSRHYERLHPGKRISGLPLNEAFYLPERLSAPRTAPVPGGDVRLLRSVLDGGDPSPSASSSPLVSASREEVDRSWAGRTFAPAAYRARLDIVDPLDRMHAGEVLALAVRVENLGHEVWPWGFDGEPEIRLTYRWSSRGGDPVIAEELRTPMPADVEPGATCLVSMSVQAPGEAGLYTLTIDLVHEHVRWFDCAASVDVEVGPRRQMAVAGPLTEEDVARLAQISPELEPVLLIRESDSPPGRYSGRRAPSADAYLLDGVPPGRAAAGLISLRLARLIVAAHAVRRGRHPRLPRGGGAFLEAVAGADTLFLKEQDGGLRREQIVGSATKRAANTLGVRVRLL